MIKIKLSEDIFQNDKLFHNNISQIMGFPNFYGHNWSAFIDCMSYIDIPKEQMTKVHVAKNECLEFEIIVKNGNKYFKRKTWAFFSSCIASINGRFEENKVNTRIIITKRI